MFLSLGVFLIPQKNGGAKKKKIRTGDSGREAGEGWVSGTKVPEGKGLSLGSNSQIIQSITRCCTRYKTETGKIMKVLKWQDLLGRWNHWLRGGAGWWQLKDFLFFTPNLGKWFPFLTSIFVQRGWFNHELVGQLILDQSDNQSVDQSSSPKQYNQHVLCHALWIRLQACVPPGTAAGDLKRVVCKTPNKHVKFAWEKNNWMKLDGELGIAPVFNRENCRTGIVWARC